MTRPILWFLAAALAVAGALCGAYFLSGSLEQFPTDEAQGKARIASGLGLVVVVLLEALVVAALVRGRKPRPGGGRG
ncbi:MAG: hypothetical protein V4757_14165 [Pseudomonadota bacterium]